MTLAAQTLDERARWLISLRWIAIAGVFLAIVLAAPILRLLPRPMPLILVGACMLAYNAGLLSWCRRAGSGGRSGRTVILLQIALDIGALTLLLYYANLIDTPFLFYFVFHIIIASILLPGATPYLLAALASVQVGGVLLLEAFQAVPRNPWVASGGSPGALAPPEQAVVGGPPEASHLYLLSVFLIFASTLAITAWFTVSLSRHVERVQAQMRQHEKMLGIGQLVAGVAHQIGNPLDGLQNCLRQIGRECRDRRLAELLPLMVAALDRIEKVARRLQAFARPQGLELAACRVNDEVVAALQLVGARLAANGIVCERELEPVPPAWGDPYALQEVVFNLCANAVEAMPEGGRLRLRTRCWRRRDSGGEPCVAIEVTDTGAGIPESLRDQIFEPFYTTKAQKGGTGLGLGLCRMLVSEMGGRIEVESAPGQGATFRVVLQAAPGGRGRR